MTAHVVALSGGKDSTAMALRLAETEPDLEFRAVLTPTGNELPAMFEHWRRLGELLGRPLEVLSREGLQANIRRNNMIPNFRARFCTRELKIEPYAEYLAALSGDGSEVVSYVGIRADEPERESGDYADIPGVTMRFPLREWGWGLKEVMGYLGDRGVEIPKRTDCALCFYQRIGEWWDLWRDHPAEFEKGVKIEAEMGHTFRSPGRDTWPAALVELRTEFESGRVPKGADVQADLFGASQCRVCRI